MTGDDLMVRWADAIRAIRNTRAQESVCIGVGNHTVCVTPVACVTGILWHDTRLHLLC